MGNGVCTKHKHLFCIECSKEALAAVKSKVQCKLCNCEGVEGTVLCREHFDGFTYAVVLLQKARMLAARDHLLMGMKQKEQDNGKSE